MECTWQAPQRAILGGLACALLLGGCAPSEVSRAARPSEEPDSQVEVTPRLFFIEEGPDLLAQVLFLMEEVGPDAHRRYEDALAAFLRTDDPLARLRNVYDGAPAGLQLVRWQVVYLAAEVKSEAAVGFLQSVALAEGPSPEGPGDAKARGGHGIPHRAPIKLGAALGIVRSYLAGVAGAEAAMLNVLQHAEPKIARVSALELVNHKRWERRFAAVLTERGIGPGFKPLTAEDAIRDFGEGGSITQRDQSTPKTRALAEGEQEIGR